MPTLCRLLAPVLGAALVAFTAWAGPARAGAATSDTVSAGVDNGPKAPPRHVMGDSDAPVTIVEFASLTCPHCREFHEQTLPKLKANWLETGKAKLVFTHYPLDRRALRAATLSNCFEGERFFAVLDMLFSRQADWARADELKKALKPIAATAGLTDERLRECLNDQAMAKRIVSKQLDARETHGIESTPTFLIDGEKVVGARDYATFREKLEAAAE